MTFNFLGVKKYTVIIYFNEFYNRLFLISIIKIFKSLQNQKIIFISDINNSKWITTIIIFRFLCPLPLLMEIQRSKAFGFTWLHFQLLKLAKWLFVHSYLSGKNKSPRVLYTLPNKHYRPLLHMWVNLFCCLVMICSTNKV